MKAAYPSIVSKIFMQRLAPQPETVKTPKGGTVKKRPISDGSLHQALLEETLDGKMPQQVPLTTVVRILFLIKIEQALT